jgi:hypothetical protein
MCNITWKHDAGNLLVPAVGHTAAAVVVPYLQVVRVAQVLHKLQLNCKALSFCWDLRSWGKQTS